MSGPVAIRGAAQAEVDTSEAIETATRSLLDAIVERNGIEPAAIVAVWFTQTPDLGAVYPAVAARRMGWDGVPMLCAQEAAVEGALPRTVRAMVLAELGEGRRPRHAYLGAARALRPDLDEEERGRQP